MRVNALAAPAREAVRAALTARGWDADPAVFAASGLDAIAVLIEDITEDEREALVRWSARGGPDVLTGEGWAVVAGAASRIAPLARYDRAAPGLERLVEPLGRVLAAHVEPPRRWQVAGATIALDAPLVVGVLNVTPDSFSDGGRFTGAEAALRHAEQLRTAGAGMLDVGGESTRPGAEVVPADVECERVVPVIAALVARGLGPVSVDTRKAAVARAALDAGAAVVNDVSGLAFDADLGAVIARGGAGAWLMHMRGTPATMDAETRYQHVAVDVARELGQAAERALAAGVAREAIVLDPGLGFAKDAEQSLRLIAELATIAAVGYPVAVGPSRKRFLGAATGRPVDDRDRATAVACALAWERGARVFRVHDVALTVEALALARALVP